MCVCRILLLGLPLFPFLPASHPVSPFHGVKASRAGESKGAYCEAPPPAAPAAPRWMGRWPPAWSGRRPRCPPSAPGRLVPGELTIQASSEAPDLDLDLKLQLTLGTPTPTLPGAAPRWRGWTAACQRHGGPAVPLLRAPSDRGHVRPGPHGQLRAVHLQENRPRPGPPRECRAPQPGRPAADRGENYAIRAPRCACAVRVGRRV